MQIDLIAFTLRLDTTTLAGLGLWSLALYLGFSPITNWLIDQLSRWFNFAERSFYTSQEEYDRTRQGRESLNTFYASLLSIIPFLMVGGMCDYGLEWSLGQSWAISLGILACMGCGVYELGRRTSEADQEDP